MDIKECNTINSYYEIRDYIIPNKDSFLKFNINSSIKIDLSGNIKKIIYIEDKKVIIKGETFGTYGVEYYLRNLDLSLLNDVKEVTEGGILISNIVKTIKCFMFFDDRMFYARIKIPSLCLNPNGSILYKNIYSDNSFVISLSLFLDPTGKINKMKREECCFLNYNRFEHLDLR